MWTQKDTASALIIPAAIYAGLTSIYDVFGINLNTSWDIYYNCSKSLFFAWFYFFIGFKASSKVLISIFFTNAFYWLINIVVELSCIGFNYNQYLATQMATNNSVVLFVALVWYAIFTKIK